MINNATGIYFTPLLFVSAGYLPRRLRLSLKSSKVSNKHINVCVVYTTRIFAWKFSRFSKCPLRALLIYKHPVQLLVTFLNLKLRLNKNTLAELFTSIRLQNKHLDSLRSRWVTSLKGQGRERCLNSSSVRLGKNCWWVLMEVSETKTLGLMIQK